jgi:hypothetical protein
MERRILEGRLRRILRENKVADRENLMNLMKKMLVIMKGKENINCYNVPQ